MLLLLLAACGPDQCPDVAALPGADAPDVLAIGDSVVSYGDDRCVGVAGALAMALGEYVEDRSVYGEFLTNPGAATDITRQYDGDAWSTVVVSGGANDVITDCSCGDVARGCEAVLDTLADATTGDGEMAALLDDVAASSGATVALLLYYAFPDDAAWNNDGCNDELATLDERYVTLAAGRPEVRVVDLRPVMADGLDDDLYAWDHVHPSDEGARRIAEAIVTALDGP